MKLLIYALISVVISVAVISQQPRLLELLKQPLSASTTNGSGKTVALATLTQVRGQVRVHSGNQWIKAQPETPLYNLDQIETSGESSAIFRTLVGDVIEVKSHTLMQFETWRKQLTLLSLLKGAIDIQQTNSDGKTFLYQHYAIKPLRKPSHDSYTIAIHREQPTVEPIVKTVITESKDQDSLASFKAIQKVMGNQKFWLDKCYAGHLKKNPKGKGEVKVFFSLSPEGKVTEAKTHSSTMNDTTMESCVVQTVLRAKFSKYTGETRQFIFPFQFNRQ